MGLVDNIKKLRNPQKEFPVSKPPHKKILIIEDEKAMAEILEAHLKKSGYSVIKAVNGEDGLETIKIVKPHLVILDLMMPIMDGKTMLHKLRRIPEFKDLPVIVLTNAGDAENLRETHLYLGAQFFVKSNVSMDEIVGAIKEMV